MSDDLASWLLAQIDEDERVARAATRGPWVWEEREGIELVSASEDEYLDEPEMAGYGKAVVRATGLHTDGYVLCVEADQKHIANFDPARVLAECEAKRLIIAFCNPVGAPDGEGRFVAESVLRLLALPYADRPGYQERWRP